MTLEKRTTYVRNKRGGRAAGHVGVNVDGRIRSSVRVVEQMGEPRQILPLPHDPVEIQLALALPLQHVDPGCIECGDGSEGRCKWWLMAAKVLLEVRLGQTQPVLGRVKYRTVPVLAIFAKSGSSVIALQNTSGRGIHSSTCY